MIWLIGAGPMAVEYAKVLQAQNVEFVVVGRGEKSASVFTEKTGSKVITGGLDRFLSSAPAAPKSAIVAVSVEQLASTAADLINYGVKKLLLEKPGGKNAAEVQELADLASQQKADVFLAYNRRFFSSVLKAREIIEEDGGVSSFNFEFTEWGHVIEGIEKAPGVKDNWFLANSTHVVDLAFFLGGTPTEIHCLTGGSLDWHPSASKFAGCGRTEKGALFSYQADWAAPGRWALEVLTSKHRLIFRPMEKLQIQKLGSVAMDFVEVDDSLDTQFKPGLYLQVENFIIGDHSELCSFEEQSDKLRIYDKIAGK